MKSNILYISGNMKMTRLTTGATGCEYQVASIRWQVLDCKYKAVNFRLQTLTYKHHVAHIRYKV